MSLGDLRRLIYRASPRTEDVRSPDRTDIIKRERGHMTLREAVDALDGLGFSAESFMRRMRQALASPDDAAVKETVATAKGVQQVCGGKSADETAIHGLFRVLESLEVLSPSLTSDASVGDCDEVAADDDTESPKENWRELVQDARASGAECFKKQDFAGALEHYSAAIRAAPKDDKEAGLHALYSNRSAARLQLGDARAALADARRCIQHAEDWPKGRFREGCCLRQLGKLAEAIASFEAGAALEPENKEWAREIEKTERLLRVKPEALIRQLFMNTAPELLRSWLRGGCAGGVLQLQVMGDLDKLGLPKFSLVQDKIPAPKAQVRFAFLTRKDYLANVAANVQQPPAGGCVAGVDLNNKALKIAEIGSFFDKAASAATPRALFHIDIKSENRMSAIVGSLACGDDLKNYLPTAKDPAPPKGAVEPVLQLQRSSGFPKALPRLLGFQSVPGDLNFPVIDIERDAPKAA
eukprot:TRINITY_DN71180_c0_g1_i1.p1 TRINITY_DN71180_c0_g1~~TRINITY_DN71180_c0_g1_i1.p1  ORF type:complete len:469 (-),score=110.01 TRINITY_DN71180_c0_g1_i1:78-1484(-)